MIDNAMQIGTGTNRANAIEMYLFLGREYIDPTFG
jgi:hypothetical protein